MVPSPLAIGLSLCDRVIIEKGTGNPTLVRIFVEKDVESFPSEPLAFSAFAPLTSGSGIGRIEPMALQLATDELIYLQRGQIVFPDRLRVVYAHFPMKKVRFPAPGSYAFMLMVDGEFIAQRRVRVYQREDLK